MSKKNKLSFEIEPFLGAKPIMFGMSPYEVKKTLGEEPSFVNNYDKSKKIMSERFSGLVTIHYDENEKVDEISFSPERPNLLIFDGKELFDPKSVRNPLSIFLKFDSNPVESVGFIYFKKLGIVIAGYHNNDKPQRGITILKETPGFAKAKPIDLSKFAEAK